MTFGGIPLKYIRERYVLCKGDNREILRKVPDNKVDAIVTDPPYGLKFMGNDWDHGVPCADFWREFLRVAKPGAHLLAFGGTRTYHRLMVAIEDAGWEIRDCLMWVYGSGFPKSLNLKDDWQGWGTALKPAWEPIILARKPLSGTVAANVLAHSTGALNIDGCRVETSDGLNGGRFPANLIHDGSPEVTELFPDSKGQQGDVRGTELSRTGDENTNCYGEFGRTAFAKRQETETSAARFFYCAKASKKDRGEDNRHPTVKPTDLMRYLCRLVTPPDGLILDPFMGSGSTGKAAGLEGFKFFGIELDKDGKYFGVAKQRVSEAFGD